jgi:hypothetical protein
LFESCLERFPAAGEWCPGGDLVGQLGVESGEGGVEDAGVGLREEDGDPSALVGQLVALGFRDPAD